MYKIGLDIMGSDNGPKVAIRAAIESIKKYRDLCLVLFGDIETITTELKKYKYNKNQIEIFGCTQVIEMTDGVLDIRRKKDSSMVRALETLEKKEISGMITAGSSASFVAGCHFILKEIKGVSRPGFMPIIPTIIKDKVTHLLDVGANLENTSKDLYTYAKIASIYAKTNYNIANPKVGLLNIGVESSKGPEFLREAYKLIKEDKNINFYGNIEGREITSGIVDVIVCDGYAGNIALKSFEGMGKNILREIKKGVKKNPWVMFTYILGFWMVFRRIKAKFNYKNYAGAIMLGVNGIAFKSHGSSDVLSFVSTIRMTYEAVKNNVLSEIEKNLK
ncbi:phosphate acyltransferase PlsX [Spiroplasma endosymbiont of Aspidapion aeneum]|uniref:phosphate acyltransferase PlsX n=1 Tax=Spiroplasma endosymbiont of Aspidapion aeneum TaxID=3066276 RepID=UPI00313B1527